MAKISDRQAAIMELVFRVARENPETQCWHVIHQVNDLAAIARSLHKRYEAACSYEWANTEKYERRTERLEEQAASLGIKLGVSIEHQRDPRGWPIIWKFKGYEGRLG